MKKSKYSESQILKILRQYDAGAKAADLCREHSISQATFPPILGGIQLEEQIRRYRGLSVEAAQRT